MPLGNLESLRLSTFLVIRVYHRRCNSPPEFEIMDSRVCVHSELFARPVSSFSPILPFSADCSISAFQPLFDFSHEVNTLLEGGAEANSHQVMQSVKSDHPYPAPLPTNPVPAGLPTRGWRVRLLTTVTSGTSRLG